MCLVLLDFQPGFLSLKAVREEYYSRPTLPLYRWDNGIVAGQDLLAGGTWLGVTPVADWAVITNIPTDKPGTRSRGDLVVHYLAGHWDEPPNVEEYGGFNLLLGRLGRVDYYSSHAPHQALDYGRYSLSNAPLGAPCPRAQQALDCENLDDLAIRTSRYGIRSSTWLTIGDVITIEERTYPSLDHRRIQVEFDNHFRPN